MAENTIQYQATVRPTTEAIMRSLERATGNLRKTLRDETRQRGREFVALARIEAPYRTGKLRKSISFKTFERDENTVEMRVYSEDPKSTWIQEGTPPHKIVAVNRPLGFYWQKVGVVAIVPVGGKPPYRGTYLDRTGYFLIIRKGYVDHPGTKANPFMKRAYDQWLPNVRAMSRRLGTRWKTDFIAGAT